MDDGPIWLISRAAVTGELRIPERTDPLAPWEFGLRIEGTEQYVVQDGSRLVCNECDRDPQTDHGNGD